MRCFETSAQANSYGWQINWVALPTAKNQVETKYYSFAGQRIAMKRDSILAYLHLDHLGSTVLQTNASGQIVADQRYYAYGKQRDTGPVGTDHRFTGQKQDASGLVYMNARYYDPAIGQFISPDTLVPDPGVLIDYNRYGYARGNPLRYTDRSGRTPWDVIDAGFWLWSANDFYNDPSWSNAGWLALDTLSLLPLAPSSGWVRRGGNLLLDLSGKTIGISADAAKLASRIQNALPVGKALSEISQQSLETINKYDIKPFEDFARPRDPSGSPVHHLVEKRFYTAHGHKLSFFQPQKSST